MLTWPWVTMEWNTPPIQAVEVSEASSGISRSPVRRMWTWGRRTFSSLAFKHHVPVRPGKEGQQSAVLPLLLAQFPSEQIRDFGLCQIQGFQQRSGAEETRRAS